MDPKVISKECIKPYTPTPLHLKTYKLSFLDQFSLSSYVHVVLFYPLDNSCVSTEGSIKQKSNHLKQSLSQTLSRFYPLAGKFNDNLSIDCNDEGVYYVESQVKSSLLDFLSHPDNSLISKFLPRNPCLDESLTGAHVALVQANLFECGGVAVGFTFNHLIFDGVGLSSFLKCWGDIARGCNGHYPDFITAPSLFPQNEAFPKELSLMDLIYPFSKMGKIVTKRFVFDSSALSELKVRATNALVQNPTRVEAVSALIWKSAVIAFRANSGIQGSSRLLHTVNMRQRTELPFSNNTMGNIITLAVSQYHPAETEVIPELDQMVHGVRESKKQIKNDSLKTFEGGKGFTNFCEDLKKKGEILSSARIANGEEVDFIGFTSWMNFGIYEVDFGWGKPVWVTPTVLSQEDSPSVLSIVVLNDTNVGNGIEAWVSLDEQDMALFQCDEELLAFSSLDPSPLHVGRSSSFKYLKI